MSFSVDSKEIMIRLIKYVLEGLMVAIAAAIIPKNKPDLQDVLIIALVAAATFSLLDMFAPSISTGVKQGLGLSIAGGILGGYPIKAV